jgi:hypothetical protein
VFNHLTQDLTLYLTRGDKEEAECEASVVLDWLAAQSPTASEPLQIGKFVATPDDDRFQNKWPKALTCATGENSWKSC